MAMKKTKEIQCQWHNERRVKKASLGLATLYFLFDDILRMDNSIHEAIYYGFERELASSMKYIFVDDDQQNTYSIENAALVLKIGAEIESVAKAICKKNEKHKDSHHFDSNCIEGNNHKISAIVIVEGDFHYNNADNIIFWPFAKDERNMIAKK